MTSELHWVDFKTGIDNQMKETITKKDSYSSDSLEDFCEGSSPDSDKSKTSSDENLDLDMNNEKSLSQSSDLSSVHDNTSITSTYSFEIIEETEALQTENITESVDIRISPRNSTIMSYNCANNFYSEFSLVANVEVKVPDANENFVDTKNSDGLDGDIQAKNDVNNANVLINEGMINKKENLPEIESIDINANDSKSIEIKKQTNGVINESITKKKSVNVAVDQNPPNDLSAPKKNEYYANKIEIKKQEKRLSSSIEKKIADEIKEMKEREEDLKAMREKLAKEISEKVVTANKIPKSSELPKSEKVVSSSPNCDPKPVIKGALTAKVENSYTKACVFAIKRKDATVKNDALEITIKSPCANIQKESPVEREIRIAKEREEELKRDREQALKSKLEMDSFNSELETDVDSALSICSDSSFDSLSKLAPLFPQTVSPEMNNSNGISLYSSSAGSICSLDSFSQREKQIMGSLSIGGSMNGSLLSPSPDSSFGKPGFPFTSPRMSAEKRSKSIDMERFISSKGKEIKFKNDSVNVTGFNSYYEIKPPQVKKGEEITCKRFITAATKIQNELKEMQEREEQYK